MELAPFARSLKKICVSRDHLPPTSTTNTTKRARLPRPTSSGYVLSFLRRCESAGVTSELNHVQIAHHHIGCHPAACFPADAGCHTLQLRPKPQPGHKLHDGGHENTRVPCQSQEGSRGECPVFNPARCFVLPTTSRCSRLGTLWLVLSKSDSFCQCCPRRGFELHDSRDGHGVSGWPSTAPPTGWRHQRAVGGSSLNIQKWFVKNSCWKCSIASCNVMMCHFSAMFFDGTFFAASGSWIPIVDAEPLLLALLICHVC